MGSLYKTIVPQVACILLTDAENPNLRWKTRESEEEFGEQRRDVKENKSRRNNKNKKK